MKSLWLPDDEDLAVEWYMSDGKPVGVESIRGGWISHRVGAITPGFTAPPVGGRAPKKPRKPYGK